jgi:hypothetical protein
LGADEIGEDRFRSARRRFDNGACDFVGFRDERWNENNEQAVDLIIGQQQPGRAAIVIG